MVSFSHGANYTLVQANLKTNYYIQQEAKRVEHRTPLENAQVWPKNNAPIQTTSKFTAAWKEKALQ